MTRTVKTFFVTAVTGTLVMLTSCAGAASAGQSGPSDMFRDEEIRYTIKKMGLKAGEASLSFKGEVQEDGRSLQLIVFTAEGFNFYDEERIYVHPQSYLPVRVVRNLNIFGNKERIIEDYDTALGEVRIRKTADGRETEQVIRKSGELENIYGFLYRVRQDADFKTGETFEIALPTRDVTMELVEEDKIKAGGKVFESFFMESSPKQYKIWFDAGSRKIPLRIDGAVGFGSTAMIMTSYSSRDEQTKPHLDTPRQAAGDTSEID